MVKAIEVPDDVTWWELIPNDLGGDNLGIESDWFLIYGKENFN